jgi:GNAT superfamily N-acetyltransferase
MAVPITADRVTSALSSDVADLVAAIGDRALVRTAGEAELLITGLALAQMNGVLTLRASAAADDVRALLDFNALKNLPHSVQIRPGCSGDIAEVAKRRGMVEEEPVPLMAMEPPLELLHEIANHPQLSIRTLNPGEAAIHTAIAAEGFGAPPELFAAMVSPALLARPGYRAYVGTVDGQPVATAMAFTSGDHVGIFDVATPPRHRARGYGAALTARAALDGFKAGASYAYLQSSAMGLSVYERLGFRILETWSMWITASE